MSMFDTVEGRCALLDLLSDQGREYERLQHDFKLLDKVFVDFLATNQHRKRC